MFAALAILLLCLLSVSQSAFPVCEKLVGPKVGLLLGDFQGTLAFVAGSLNHPSALEALKLRDSITVFLSNTSDTSAFSYTQVNRFGDQCQHLPYNMSVEGSRFTFEVGSRFSLSGYFLYTTCPDCLVMQWVVKSRKRHSLDMYLLSRRRQLSQPEMDEFTAQLRCLQLPPPVIMDPRKELCEEQHESHNSTSTTINPEEKTVLQ